MTDVIILNAGLSKRMQEKYPGIPKALIAPKAGISILEFQLHILEQLRDRIDRVVLVLGYQHERFHEFLESLDLRILEKLRFAMNEDYATTDNAYSVYLGLQVIPDSEQVIIVDGDMVFEAGLLQDLLDHPAASCVVGKRVEHHTSEDAMVVAVCGHVVGVGKEVESDILYCSIAKIGSRILASFRNELADQMWWKTWYSAPLTKLLETAEPVVALLDAGRRYFLDVDQPEELAAVSSRLSQMASRS